MNKLEREWQKLNKRKGGINWLRTRRKRTVNKQIKKVQRFLTVHSLLFRRVYKTVDWD